MTVTPTSTSDASEARHIASKATVYYNSACPVCNAGICAMQERTASDKGIEWIDVHRNPEVLDALGLQLEDVRERLHFADSDGRMRVGADAVAEALLRVPRWRVFAVLLRWWGLRYLAQVAYDLFAQQLYRWNRSKNHW